MRGIPFLWVLMPLVLVFCGCAGSLSNGSDKSMYTIADTLEVHRADLAKTMQLRLDQKVMFDFEEDPQQPGEWSLVDYSNRVMILLSDTPRLPTGDWGVLLQARSLGYGSVTLKFTPADETKEPTTYTMDFSIRK